MIFEKVDILYWRFILKDTLNGLSLLLEVSFIGKKTFSGAEEIIDRNLQEEVNLEEDWSIERTIWSNLDLEDGLEKEVSKGGFLWRK